MDVRVAQTRRDPVDLDCQSPRYAEVFALPQLRQHLLTIVLELGIVFFGILHGEPFFDKVATFIFSAHLYVDCTESDIMH